MCELRCCSAWITSPSADKDLLMLWASFKRSPCKVMMLCHEFVPLNKTPLCFLQSYIIVKLLLVSAIFLAQAAGTEKAKLEVIAQNSSRI
jgi:hypothetical protein